MRRRAAACIGFLALAGMAFAVAVDAAEPAKPPVNKPPVKKSQTGPKTKPAIQRTLAFDGRYSGVMTVNPGLSGPGCHDITVSDFVINGGVIKPAGGAASLQPVF